MRINLTTPRGDLALVSSGVFVVPGVTMLSCVGLPRTRGHNGPDEHETQMPGPPDGVQVRAIRTPHGRGTLLYGRRHTTSSEKKNIMVLRALIGAAGRE